MTSYLCKSPAHDTNISDNGHLKHEENKKYKSNHFDQVVGFLMERLVY